MSAPRAICEWLQRNSISVMALSLFVGLVFPPVAAALSPVVFPFAVLTMMLALLRMDWTLVATHLRRPLVPVALALATLCLTPLLPASLAAVLGIADSPIAVGMVLVSATPSLLSAPAYAIMLGLDSAFALVVSVPASLATPIVMPFVVGGLLDVGLEISMLSLTIRLGIIVGVAFVGAWVVRRLAGPARIVEHAPYVDSLMLFLLCSFGIGVMDGIGALVLAEPAKALRYIGFAFGLCAAMQLLALVSLRWLGPHRALTLALVWGFRNGILVLAAVGDSGGPDVKLFLICYQFPLYMAPALMRPVFRRMLGERG